MAANRSLTPTFRFLVGVALLLSLSHAAPAKSQSGKQPADPATIFQRGQQALANEDLAAAESAFHQVLKIDPRSAAARANLGVVAMRRKDWEQALFELHKAEKLDPKMAGVRLNIGLVEYKRGNYPDAIEPFSSFLHDQRR